MPSTCYLFNEIRFHFHFVLRELPAMLQRAAVPLESLCKYVRVVVRSGSYVFTLCDPVTFTFDL